MNAKVTTRLGYLEGEDQGGILVFKGVPFAAPPVGALRWMPPQKPLPWTGTRDARRFGFVAPQNRPAIAPLSAMNVDGEQSEDCLNLNIWTPGLTGAPRPVMVWIHGGAFTFGSGSQPIYDGSVLARRGEAVIVTINYRLGPLGFMRLCDLTGGRIPSTGNEALLDQIAALEWVRDNIAEFGGDPENITIFGQSAGGMCVAGLLLLPRARGLFRRAIPQSGACNTPATAGHASRIAERLLSKIGVTTFDADALRALPPAALLETTAMEDALTPDGAVELLYRPVVDGAILPLSAMELLAAGSVADVEVMAGTTLEEWKLFSLMDSGLAALDRSRLAGRFERLMERQDADGLIGAYEAARAGRGDSTAPGELFNAIETDRLFRIPTLRLSETQSRRGHRTYSYLFTYKSPAIGGTLGSCHGIELGFVFGTNRLPGMDLFSGTGPAVDRLGIAMQDAWLAFARGGDPGCDSLGDWPTYDETARATMVIGETNAVRNAPLEGERRAWDALPAEVVGTP
ncbi:MAG: carboxylesterase/lipase family protein [Candidatus Binataceae bacterium]